MTKYLAALAALALCACLPGSEGDGTCPPTDPTSSGTPSATTTAELDALASWGPRTVSLAMPDGKAPVTGNRLVVLVESGTVDRMDVVTTLTRAQDYNSSRSNKSSVAFSDDALPDADSVSMNPYLLTWDGGPRCEALPCSSAGRADGAASRLAIEPGDGLVDGQLVVTWGETTPVDIDFSGFVSVGAEMTRHRGHVTVLKAAASGDGDVDITTALDAKYVAVYDGVGDYPLYEGAPLGGENPLATVSGTTGSSWPNGISVEEGPAGTLISFHWD